MRAPLTVDVLHIAEILPSLNSRVSGMRTDVHRRPRSCEAGEGATAPAKRAKGRREAAASILRMQMHQAAAVTAAGIAAAGRSHSKTAKRRSTSPAELALGRGPSFHDMRQHAAAKRRTGGD